MLFCGRWSIPLRASPAIRPSLCNKAFKKLEDDSCPWPLPYTSDPPIHLPRSQGQLHLTRKLRLCLLSPESPLTQGGWSPVCSGTMLCHVSRGPQESSFFCITATMMPRPNSLRRARTGQRPKLWCTRNGLNRGRQPHRVAQQAVHPHDGVHILHLREDMLYAYPNVPSRAVNLWFLFAAEVSIDRRELGPWLIEQVSLAIDVCRLPLRLFKELGREHEAISCLPVHSPCGPSLG